MARQESSVRQMPWRPEPFEHELQMRRLHLLGSSGAPRGESQV